MKVIGALPACQHGEGEGSEGVGGWHTGYQFPTKGGGSETGGGLYATCMGGL